MGEKTVLISYRRDATGKAFARSVKEALTHRGYDVFLDVDTVEAGPWEEQILTQVPKRAHFLLLLTPGALDRCADTNDWVRREFLTAVASGRNIVPVREESAVPSARRLIEKHGYWRRKEELEDAEENLTGRLRAASPDQGRR